MFGRIITILAVGVGAVITAGTIPFDPSRGLVEVEVTINGHVKGVFGIDTGADRLYIDRDFARRNNLTFRPLSPRQGVTGLDGSDLSTAVSLQSLRVADSDELKNISAAAIDMDAFLHSDDESPIDGLIGYEVLRRFYLTIDYPNQSMEIENSRPDFLRGKAYYEVPYRAYEHLVLVDVVINDRVTVPMILDYCASYTTISESLAERLDLESDESRTQRLSKVRLGDKTVSTDVPVFVADLRRFRKTVPRAQFEGILGGSFLYRYKVTIDYAHQKVYIHK